MANPAHLPIWFLLLSTAQGMNIEAYDLITPWPGLPFFTSLSHGMGNLDNWIALMVYMIAIQARAMA